VTDNVRKAWQYLTSHGLTKAGAAGLLGNLQAESGVRPNVYEHSKKKRIGLSDADYVRKTNDGSYKNFVNDKAGFGLAQWTYHSRKQALLNMCRGRIGDINCQLKYLVKELSGYRKLYSILTSTKDVNTACDRVLLEFERPANAKGKINQRRSYCRNYY
jgi:hypothetical protein